MAGEGITQHLLEIIEDLELQVIHRTNNVSQLLTERDDLILQLITMSIERTFTRKPSESIVAEVVKVLGKSKVLVKFFDGNELKLVVNVADTVDVRELTPSKRVAVWFDSPPSVKGPFIHVILPDDNHSLAKHMKVEEVPDTTFDMVAGLDQQILEIMEVIQLPIKHPELLEMVGVDAPKGILLYGPPGNGKTTHARAVAHHAKCSFFRTSGTELVQGYSGSSILMLKQLFDMAKFVNLSLHTNCNFFF